jgi:hypothetical protein
LGPIVFVRIYLRISDTDHVPARDEQLHKSAYDMRRVAHRWQAYHNML